ncbi:hydroxypyruvate isomerase [Rhizobium sp. AU243]|nr:hydroxypyruvate isomerase [Rhizobium sp. AU243]
MNSLSAHIGYLFGEYPLIDRIAAAAKCGFTAVEHPQPFEVPASQLKRLLEDYGLAFIQHAAAIGSAAKGEKGLACLPGREAEFRDEFDRALEYAVTVGASYIHPMSGVADPMTDRSATADTYRNNIEYAVQKVRGSDVRILLEAISDTAVHGYYLSTLETACAIQDCFGNREISLLLDTYHAAVNGIESWQWAEGNIERIGHMHMADYPGRNEPGSGKVDFHRLLGVLQERSYSGALGFEYVPSGATEETLTYLTEWRSALASG